MTSDSLKRGYCLVALAGFGREFFEIRSGLETKFRQKCKIVGRNMELFNGIPVYKQNHLADLLEDICEYAFPESKSAEGFCPPSNRQCRFVSNPSSAICASADNRACRDRRPGSILVVWREGAGEDPFLKALNPCTYLCKLPAGGSETQIVRVINTHLEFAEGVLREEIHHNPKRTPILLPLRNFELDHTSRFVASLHNHPEDAQQLIDGFRSSWFDSTYRHPKRGRPGAFVDSRQIGFSKDPGFHDRRVSRQSDRLKTNLRLLTAFYRFGIPYEIGFHYDVCRSRRSKPRPLNAFFWNAAREANEYRTEGYLNIAPNDEIR